jgi:hypothetical protein
MLDPVLGKLIKKQEELGGIDVFKLKPGTLITVRTKNSLYKFKTTDKQGKLLGIGGKYLPEEREIYFSGSTFGGSCIKIGWIGYLMHMELWIGKKVIKTTSVQDASIEGDGWKYEMDWKNKVA